MNHSVDRRMLCLIPQPAWEEREEEGQGDQASCDETYNDKTRMLNSRMCVDEVSRAREKCASVVRTVRCYCLHSPSRARHSVMSARDFFEKKKND